MGRKLRRTAAFTALWRAMTAGSRGGPPLGRRLAAIPRMMKETAAGRYDGGMRLAMITAAAVYVVSPIDVVPEAFLLVVGLADDALMVAWLAGAVLDETERFLTWEAVRKSTIPGEVVR
jgi:uncharacterized membrane protein YkvA (DUF1232 family)